MPLAIVAATADRDERTDEVEDRRQADRDARRQRARRDRRRHRVRGVVKPVREIEPYRRHDHDHEQGGRRGHAGVLPAATRRSGRGHHTFTKATPPDDNQRSPQDVNRGKRHYFSGMPPCEATDLHKSRRDTEECEGSICPGLWSNLHRQMATRLVRDEQPVAVLFHEEDRSPASGLRFGRVEVLLASDHARTARLPAEHRGRGCCAGALGSPDRRRRTARLDTSVLRCRAGVSATT